MEQTRFEEIKKIMHFNDNDSLTADNKFAKIKHLLNVLNKSLLQFDKF